VFLGISWEIFPHEAAAVVRRGSQIKKFQETGAAALFLPDRTEHSWFLED
jgi:hypothetical protein